MAPALHFYRCNACGPRVPCVRDRIIQAGRRDGTVSTERRFPADRFLALAFVVGALLLGGGSARAAAQTPATEPPEPTPIVSPDPGPEELRIVAAMDWCAASLAGITGERGVDVCAAAMSLAAWAAPSARLEVGD